ncbi:MAG: hypothetical protein HC822_01140 [Oscillochloris sp.]|nr:hypothetical protein [Oscillochloris sp.]
MNPFNRALSLIIPDVSASPPPLRVICLALPGRLAEAALQELLAAYVVPAALLLPAPPGSAPLELPPPAAISGIALAAPPPALRTLAAAHAVPVFGFDSSGAQAPYFLQHMHPDVAIVCGWPRRIGPGLLRLPRHGFLNLHPSFLPELRGPEPLFWAFRSGAERSGVTIHLMDERFDTGPICAQAPFELPAGTTGAAAEVRAGALGGRLLLQTLAALVEGRAVAQPQGPGSYRPAPQAADFRLDPGWSARRAFGFMRGTGEWRQPYPIRIAGRELHLDAAIDYAARASQSHPLQISGEIAAIQFQPGILHARLARR